MKKTCFFYLAALCLFFVSCKKDKKDEDTSFHITCKVDGTSKAFNSTAFAVKGSAQAKGLAINGATALTDGADGFVFVISDTEKDVTPGTYTDNGTGYSLIAAYHDGGSNTDYDAGTELSLDAAANNKTIANHFKVVITSVDDKAVKGTFSGDFYADGDLNGTKKFLAEGSFYVPLIQQ